MSSSTLEQRPPVQTIAELLAMITRQLESGGVEGARREAVDIVSSLFDVPRFWPAANLDSDAPGSVAAAAKKAAVMRIAGAPIAYAVGRASFRHLTLDVDENVLIPRVETEILVERVLERASRGTRTIADIGTGSGAIALSLAFERDFDAVIGTDISLGALRVARRNADRLGGVLKSPVRFLHGAGVAPLAGARLDAVVCNPPYCAYSEGAVLPSSVRDWEPSLALLSADDGLAVTRSVIAGAPAVLAPGGILALEVDTRRAGTVAEIVAVDGRYFAIEVLADLTGRERFVFARRV